MKQKLADLKGETDNENIIFEDFNTQLSTQKKQLEDQHKN